MADFIVREILFYKNKTPGGCPRIDLYVISTEGKNLKLAHFQHNKISRYARNDSLGEFSDSLL